MQCSLVAHISMRIMKRENKITTCSKADSAIVESVLLIIYAFFIIIISIDLWNSV